MKKTIKALSNSSLARITYIVCAVIAILILAGCSKEKVIAPAAPAQPSEQAQQPEAAPAQAPVATGEAQLPPPEAQAPSAAQAPAAPSALDKVDEKAAKVTGDESQLKALETNTNMLEEQTIWGTAAEINKKKEDKSWFEAVNCKRYVGPPQGYYKSTGTKKEDKISFRLKNNDDRQYFLGYAKVLELIHKDNADKTKVPMILRINGNRIRDVKECCGTELLEPGQTIECKECKANLRYEEDKKYMREETQLKNNLEAVSSFVSTQFVFECR